MSILGAKDAPDEAQRRETVGWLHKVLDPDTVLPTRITSREPDVTGRCMTDEMVSRSEIWLAMSQLSEMESAAVALKFGPHDFSYDRIGRIIGYPGEDVAHLISAAITQMVERIFGY